MRNYYILKVYENENLVYMYHIDNDATTVDEAIDDVESEMQSIHFDMTDAEQETSSLCDIISAVLDKIDERAFNVVEADAHTFYIRMNI